MLRRVCVLASLVLVSACGDSPTDPSNFLQVAGTYTGTLTSDTYLPAAVTMQLTQSAGTVTGTWVVTAATAGTGTISGSVDQTSFTGTATLTFPNSSGCSAALAGASAGTTLTLTSPGFTGNCALSAGNPLNVRIALQR